MKSNVKIENRENNQNNEKHEMILIIFHEQDSGFRSTKPLEEGLDFQQIDLVFCSNSKSSFMKERKSFLMVTQMMIVKVNKKKSFLINQIDIILLLLFRVKSN